MNDLLDDDASLSRRERELTLSTGAILGIFFGLVLLCGACFGVGYNMGRKSAPTPLALNDNPTPDAAADAGTTAKPSAGSPLETTSLPPHPISAAPAPVSRPAPIVRRPPVTVPEEAPEVVSSPPPARVAAPATAPPVRSVSPNALMPGATGVSASGSIVVQVAAVSHQDDAELLVGALRARGYTVSARPSASDGFIHVQVGPFSNKKDAEAMRQRLLADGYNAILK